MRALLIVLILSFFITPIMAQQPNAPEPPQSLKDMVSQGAQIFYLGEYEGMHGWALVRNGTPEYFYENKARTAMVMGLLFNDAGEMMTMAQLKSLHDRVGSEMYAVTGGEYVKPSEAATAAVQNENDVTAAPVASPNRQLTKAELMYTDLIAANWITMNPDGQNDVFAFIDPDCPHCQNFIRTMSDAPEGIRLRIIPIGVNENSLKRAAVLLASNDVERLVKYANGDKSALTAPDNISLEAVQDNFSIMTKHGFDVTPIVVYRTGKGDIRMIRGQPSNMSVIADDIIEN